MAHTLANAAARLGISRPQLIKRMRAAGLLDAGNLPAHPERDRLHLKVHEGHWYHPTLGMQYSRSTRVTRAGLHWLAAQLDIDMPPPPLEREGRDVA